jgi:hypothetical protein
MIQEGPEADKIGLMGVIEPGSLDGTALGRIQIAVTFGDKGFQVYAVQ